MLSVGTSLRPVQRLCWLAALLSLAASGQTLRFGVIGDSGTGDHRQRAVARRMEATHQNSPWQFVLMLGDNIYEDGNPADFDRKFKDVYRNLTAAGVRFHATLGNHDAKHPLARRGLAQVEDDAFGFLGRQAEYALVAGPEIRGKPLARFLALHADAWLEDRRDPACLEAHLARLRGWLAESDRYHWNFVFLHNPLYAFVVPKIYFLFGRWGHRPEEGLRQILEPEMKGKVNAVFSGHEHFYQKIKPQQGIHYFISGGGGKIRRGARKQHPEVEYAAETLHFLDIELSEGRLRYAAIDDNGATIHSGAISR